MPARADARRAGDAVRAPDAEPRATNRSYVTTEVWTHFDEIWVQPLYVPVDGWQTGKPQRPVDGREAGSSASARAAASTARSGRSSTSTCRTTPTTETLTSAREVLDSGIRCTPDRGGPCRSCPTVMPPPGRRRSGSTRRRLGRRPAAGRSSISAARRSHWDDERVIEEMPDLRACLSRARDGAAGAPRHPDRRGVGPPYSQHRCAADRRATSPATRRTGACFWWSYRRPSRATGARSERRGVRAAGRNGAVRAAHAMDSPSATTRSRSGYARRRQHRLRDLRRARGTSRGWRGWGGPECFDDPTLYPIRSEQGRMRLARLAERNRGCTSTPAQIIRTDVTVTCPVSIPAWSD